jgi:hypothetical protein
MEVHINTSIGTYFLNNFSSFVKKPPFFYIHLISTAKQLPAVLKTAG